jgi:hypothetical protein
VRYRRELLTGEEWTKFVFHRLRYPDNIAEKIEAVLAWCEENVPEDQYMRHVVDRNNAALLYFRDDGNAALFKIAAVEHSADCRGRKVWL